MSDAGIVGQLFKVLRVDHDDDTIHVQTQKGQTGRVSNLTSIDDVEPGDVILVGQDDWEFAPADLWQESKQIATVRLVLDDNTVLVDGGIGNFQRVANTNGIMVKVGNVVEYGDAQGLLSVVSERPIKSSLLGDENENVESEYLRDKAGAGPTFKDFGGYPHVVARAKELIETQLERQEQLESIGARPIKASSSPASPARARPTLPASSQGSRTPSSTPSAVLRSSASGSVTPRERSAGSSKPPPPAAAAEPSSSSTRSTASPRSDPRTHTRPRSDSSPSS